MPAKQSSQPPLHFPFGAFASMVPLHQSVFPDQESLLANPVRDADNFPNRKLA